MEHRIYGGAGNDKIYLYSGAIETLKGGSGDDTIVIAKGALDGDSFKGYKFGMFRITEGNDGNDTITIEAGNYHCVEAGTGDDSITVTAGRGHLLQGQAGNDTVVVSNSDGIAISGDDGNDVITVTNCNYNTEESEYANYNGYCYINGNSGDDRITVNGGNSNYIYSGDGLDTIVVRGGSNHKINLGSGTNIVDISSTNATIDHDGYTAADKITVHWSETIGTLQINTVSSAADSYTDYLTIKGAGVNDFNFKKKYNTLVLESRKNAGCSIEICDWDKYQPFAQGITFDGQTLSYAQINEKAGA